MMNTWLKWTLTAWLLGWSIGGAGAEGLSHEMEAALRQMGTGTYKTREEGLAAVRVAMGKELAALVKVDDPEMTARVGELLEFQRAVARWAGDMLKLPPDTRRQAIQWGLQHMDLIGRTYSERPERRLAAVGEAGKLQGEEPARLLAQLLRDQDREVYLAAMENVWDRKATDDVVDALWTRAVEAGMQMYRPGNHKGVKQLTFRGKPVGGATPDANLFRRQMDHNLATDTLIHLKDELVVAKLENFLEQGLRASETERQYKFNMYGTSVVNVYKMVEEYRPKSVVGLLMELANQPMETANRGNINREAYVVTNRTWPLAMVVSISGQKPEDLGLKRIKQANNTWAFATEAEENKALEKLNRWWENHRQEYPAKKPSPETRPGGNKVLIPAPGRGLEEATPEAE